AMVRTLYPANPERAWEVLHKVERGDRMARQPFCESGSFSLNLRRIYAYYLRRAVNGPDAAARLIRHVFGASSHWSDLLGVTIWLAGVAVPLKLWLLWHPDTALSKAIIGVCVVPVTLMIMLAQLHRVWLPVSRAGATTVEQSLYRLTPKAPGAASFNRVFAANIVRAGLQDWLLLTASGLGVSLIFQVPASFLVPQACAFVLVLPSIAGPLLDYSKAAVLRGWGYKLLGTLAVTAVSVALCIYFGVYRDAGQCLTWALVCDAAALILVLARRRTMLAAPVAFPAGRMDD